MAPGSECYAPGVTADLQIADAEPTEGSGSEDDAQEKEKELPSCTGAKGEDKTSCVKRKPKPLCKGNALPKV